MSVPVYLQALYAKPKTETAMNTYGHSCTTRLNDGLNRVWDESPIRKAVVGWKIKFPALTLTHDRPSRRKRRHHSSQTLTWSPYSKSGIASGKKRDKGKARTNSIQNPFQVAGRMHGAAILINAGILQTYGAIADVAGDRIFVLHCQGSENRNLQFRQLGRRRG